MVLNVDVLCSCVVFRIMGKGNSALIVTVDDVLIVDVVADFVEEAVESDKLLEGMEESHVFRFHAGERN